MDSEGLSGLTDNEQVAGLGDLAADVGGELAAGVGSDLAADAGGDSAAGTGNNQPPAVRLNTRTWSAPIFEVYCELEGAIRGSVKIDEPMSRHTSFRIGGLAALYIECASLADLTLTLETVRRYGLAWAIVGKGTNLLVSDRGFEGAIICLGREFKSFHFPDSLEAAEVEEAEALPAEPAYSQPGGSDADDEGTGSVDLPEPAAAVIYDIPAGQPRQLLVAGAGVTLGNLVRNAFKNGYTGLEFAVGIPGTLGGAIFMNAGTAEEWIGSIVSSVLVYDPDRGLVRLAGDQIDWGYRSSGLGAGLVILEAELRVTRGNTSHIRARMEGISKRRTRTQPQNLPNAGSIFRNPEGASAGQLIDSLGLKGLSVGGAQVSEVHANFIVNNGSATAADVIALIQEIRAKVKESYGFELQTEIRFIGFE